VTRDPWLWSRRTDLTVFLGTAAVALALVPLAPMLGVGADGSGPEWTWIAGVLLVDVAHVWSTAFVVYLDPVELRRRRTLYLATPIACWLAGIALYQLGEATFWRAIAYLAIFHFVRQQWGWVAMYRGRAGERGRLGKWIDAAAIYAATIYPLIVWHCELPRAFWWMREGDLADGLPARVGDVAGVVYLAILAAYVANAIASARRGRTSWGKHAVVATTAACWYVGIVATNSDYAFTVTNVFIHGVPYLVLVFAYARAAAAEAPRGASARVLAGGVVPFVATLWLLAYVEELIWDRHVWHDRTWLFGDGDDTGVTIRMLLIPLLAVPQLTHYVLDGFLWRRASNPRLARLLRR
jgi:hypothetical protein